MKLFPTRKFLVVLRSDYSISVENLKLNTDITDSLVSAYTNNKFRGQINEKGFKLISSKIGTGAYCVLIGDFNKMKGKIEVRIHNAFKIMLSIILLYPFIGYVFIAYNQGIEQSIEFIPILLMALLLIRFVFIELTFRIVCNESLKKMKEVLNIVELRKV